MSNQLVIHLNGSESSLESGLQVLKNLPSNITSLKFVDDEKSEYMHDNYGIEDEHHPAPDQSIQTVPDFTGTLEGVVFPNQITELIFELYRSSLAFSIIPKHGNLKVLHCGHAFDREFKIDSTTFPEGLETLIFPHCAKFTMDCIPKSVKVLDMQHRYDVNVVEFPPEFFPPGLTRFSSPKSFNQSLSVIPRSVEYLELNAQFNQIIVPGDIPSGCKFLNLSSNGNTNSFIGVTSLLVPGSIPEGVLVLKINQNFNQDLAGLLPSSLLKLQIQSGFTHPFKPNDLPASLKVLDLCFCHDVKCEFNADNLPPNLKVLRLNKNITLAQGFNPSIETISLDHKFKKNPNEDKELLNI